MIEIQDLHVKTGNKEILKGLNLTINPGEKHALMGPNGSGKSTLSQVIAGREGYEITQGSIKYLGQDLTKLTPEQRALNGIFLAFQYPVSIPGVSNINFLKTALNNLRKHQGLPALDAVDFLTAVKDNMQQLGMPQELLTRSVNQGFSGGEKKRNEILQMTILQPKFAILDETDSGLDIDALKIVAAGVNQMHNAARSFLLITHYQRLLDYIKPDRVHVLIDGKIIKSGDSSLALELEKLGYNWAKSPA